MVMLMKKWGGYARYDKDIDKCIDKHILALIRMVVICQGVCAVGILTL